MVAVRMDGTAILIPLLGRPHRVAPVLESITAGTPEPHRVVFIVSPDDRDVMAAVFETGLEPLIMKSRLTRGDYAAKIHYGIANTTEPLIFTGADDLNFHPGWLTAAYNCGEMHGARVIGTNDLCNARVMRGEHGTHFLVHRSYIDEMGTIDEPGLLFHPGYWHEYVDDELVATAKLRGEYVTSLDAVVEHLHPMAGKAPMDSLYAQQTVRMFQGRDLFRRRSHLWTSPS